MKQLLAAFLFVLVVSSSFAYVSASCDYTAQDACQTAAQTCVANGINSVCQCLYTLGTCESNAGCLDQASHDSFVSQCERAGCSSSYCNVPVSSSCSGHTSCSSCAADTCAWCETTRTCIDFANADYATCDRLHLTTASCDGVATIIGLSVVAFVFLVIVTPCVVCCSCIGLAVYCCTRRNRTVVYANNNSTYAYAPLEHHNHVQQTPVPQQPQQSYIPPPPYAPHPPQPYMPQQPQQAPAYYPPQQQQQQQNYL